MALVWADWLILGIIGVSSLVGMIRGLIKEALSLVNLAAAFLVAMSFKSQLAPMLGGWLSTPSLRELAAFAMLFLMTLIAGSLLNYLLSQLVRATGLSGTDRLLGVLFGALRGVAIVLAMVIIIPKILPVEQDPWWQASTMIAYFKGMEGWAIGTADQAFEWFKSLF
ncbi:CvpA family protein [Pseudoteredinibacter isoporae]|uniref:Membrane protein required for colicin V production n=1 Tax=Pseudoteredinibacter isoporae TaxID=570281 RepID=A0A7X0JW49_9GAMM|nr:CvpA family protein [Pseudoteredinibacter isoporae]MBB6523355.1 membrane protein required for colicin V production [Pseudoteredinibacter isoporae]NHO88868.1 CvpA family protein [Pseudoteredinibacter isoporae]NIB24424.1 CvpA family protein [Pseudoteredinibacter isoporae]